MGRHPCTEYKLVALVWVDSDSAGGPWQKISRVDPRLDHILSVGLLLKETEAAYCISSSISGWENAIDVLTIPKVSVVRKKFLPLKWKALLGEHFEIPES